MVVDAERCYTIYQIGRYALTRTGEFAECGTFRGGTAHLIAAMIQRLATTRPRLHLFDTFAGMPATSLPHRDHHRPGDFSDTSLGQVQERLRDYDFVDFHPGLIPATFSEVSSAGPIAFVHVDVDIYPSVLACCEWFWPRLAEGGVMVFDDYGFPVYRNAARAAIDDYFGSRSIQPIVLSTGQALVIRSHPDGGGARSNTATDSVAVAGKPLRPT
ncbi:MAG: TylF/MycF family methyltransferase [Chloroflexota bacterium]|nr:TylF/MycF family methyltransferase [Chloroflexota bacterium]